MTFGTEVDRPEHSVWQKLHKFEVPTPTLALAASAAFPFLLVSGPFGYRVGSGTSAIGHAQCGTTISRETKMNIFVGNLPFSATEGDLRQLFSEYGTVDSAAVITDRDTGRSRGFGFVELAADARADDALRDLDGTDLNGRNIKVNEAKPRN